MSDIGNRLYQRASVAKTEIFLQGELAQLTYLSYQETAQRVQDGSESEIEISYPVGYRPDRSVIPSTRKYSKEELIQRYVFLGNHQLAINGIYQLVTILESLFGDLVRIVLLKYPQKIGSKKTIQSSVVLAAHSIEEIHLKAIDSILKDMTYKSPNEFAVELKDLMSMNLLECPAFHRYLEIKATRDIYIHNRGIANEVYVTKAGSHSRVKAGEFLPIDTIYFLESFEFCIQIVEWTEKALHTVWHSSDYEQQVKQSKDV